MRNTLIIGVIGVLLSCGGLVRAEYITIAISGQVTKVSDQYNNFGGQISIGDVITGTYTYHSTTFDSDPASDMGVYDDYVSPAGMTLTVSGVVFETDTHNIDLYIGVNNDAHLEDKLNIASNHNLPLSNGMLVQHIIWQLDDPTSTALSSDALPLTAPDLTKWNSNVLNISTDRNFGITATITSAVIVPEPCSILLLLAGGIVFHKQKHTR